MQTITLPQGKAFFSQRAELDGVPFALEFSWVERAGAWSLAVRTDDGALLVSGIAIVANRLLLRRFKYITGMPEGDLMFPSRAEDLPVPGYTDFTELVYFLAEELL
jgi:hypothetical protein